MVFSNTVQTLRHDAARRVRDHWAGSLTAAVDANAASILDSSRVEVTDFFQNGYLHLDVDSDAEDLRVTGNDQDLNTVSIAPVTAAAHDQGTAYEIHKLWSVPEYNGFIADALKSVATEAVTAHLDNTSLTVTANANKPGGIEDEYAIPSGFRYIDEVWVADQVGHFDVRIPNSEVRAIPGSTKKLRFSLRATAAMQVGRTIRLLGQGPPDASSLQDSTVIYIDPDYIVSYVELQVLQPLSGGDTARERAARARVQFLQAYIEDKRYRAVTEHRVLPGSIVVPS